MVAAAVPGAEPYRFGSDVREDSLKSARAVSSCDNERSAGSYVELDRDWYLKVRSQLMARRLRAGKWTAETRGTWYLAVRRHLNYTTARGEAAADFGASAAGGGEFGDDALGSEDGGADGDRGSTAGAGSRGAAGTGTAHSGHESDGFGGEDSAATGAGSDPGHLTPRRARRKTLGFMGDLGRRMLGDKDADRDRAGSAASSVGSAAAAPTYVVTAEDKGKLNNAYAFGGIHHLFHENDGAAITSLRFAHNDADLLCWGAEDGTVIVSRAKARNPTVALRLTGHTGAVLDLAWSLSNEYIVSTSADRTLRLWDAEVEPEDDPPRDGDPAAGSGDRPGRNGGRQRCLRIIYGTVRQESVRFHPSNANMFVTCGGTSVTGWNLSTGKSVWKVPVDCGEGVPGGGSGGGILGGSARLVSRLGGFATGRRSSGGADGGPSRGRSRFSSSGSTSPADATAGAAPAASASAGSAAGSAVPDGAIALSLVIEDSASRRAGGVILVGDTNGGVTCLVLRDLQLGKVHSRVRYALSGAGAAVTSLEYRRLWHAGRSGGFVLANCCDSNVRLLLIAEPGHDDARAASPSLRLPSTSSSPSASSNAGCPTLRESHRFVISQTEARLHGGFCPLIGLNRGGSCVVSGSEDGAVYVFDMTVEKDKGCINKLQGHSSPVLAVSWNFDETLLATCDRDGMVFLWKREQSINTADGITSRAGDF